MIVFLYSIDAAINRLTAVNASLRDEIVRIMRQLTDSETELRELKQRYKKTFNEQQQTLADFSM